MVILISEMKEKKYSNVTLKWWNGLSCLPPYLGKRIASFRESNEKVNENG